MVQYEYRTICYEFMDSLASDEWRKTLDLNMNNWGESGWVASIVSIQVENFSSISKTKILVIVMYELREEF